MFKCPRIWLRQVKVRKLKPIFEKHIYDEFIYGRIRLHFDASSTMAGYKNKSKVSKQEEFMKITLKGIPCVQSASQNSYKACSNLNIWKPGLYSAGLARVTEFTLI